MPGEKLLSLRVLQVGTRLTVHRPVYIMFLMFFIIFQNFQIFNSKMSLRKNAEANRTTFHKSILNKQKGYRRARSEDITF